MVDNSSTTVPFNEYFKVIRTRFWIIFTIFVLTIGSGWYVTDQVLPKIYSATTQIRISPRGEEAVNSFDGMGTDRPFDETAFQSELTIMRSSQVLLPVIIKLGLDKKWAKTVMKSSEARMTPLEALNYLHNNLKIDFERGTSIIDITAESQDPGEAAEIANGVANSYKEMRDADEATRANAGTETIRDQIALQQKIVEQRQADVEKLRVLAGQQGVSFVPGTNGVEQRSDEDLAARKRDLLSAKEDADSRRVLMNSVENLPDDEFVNTLGALGSHEVPNITGLRADAFRLQGDIANLLQQGFEENHPRVLAMKAELAQKQQQIKDLIEGTRRAIKIDSQMADSRVALLTEQVNQLTAKTQKDEASAVGPFHEAYAEYQRQQSILDAYGVHLKQVIADSHLMESPVKIVAVAQTPEFPSKPSRTINLAVSGLAGLFLGVSVAFLIEYLDTSVKTMADAESLLGLPVLAVIPNKGGPLPLDAQGAARSPHAEGYRILRAKLDLKVQNGIGPSLSMLSGGPGEGKSTTLYNMAVVCAQAGQSVILVDCDLRRPTIDRLVKVSGDKGMADYLRGQGDVLDFIQQTPLPNLHILPAGDMKMEEIGTLTAGDKIRQMLDELKQRYDLVLVDSPPILGVSDGSIIAREVDYVILVIQHRRYPREISLRAKRAIEEVHGNCVGMVLNSVAVGSDDSYYYYSNYGNYYKKTDRKKKNSLKIKTKAGAKTKPKEKAALASTRKTDLESDEF